MPVPNLQDVAALLDAGKAQEVVASLQPVVTTMPSYAAAHVLLARAYGMTEQWAEAHAMWQKACLLLPSSQILRAGLLHSTQMLRRAAHARRSAPVAPPSEDQPDAPASSPTSEAIDAPEPVEVSDSAVSDSAETVEPVEAPELVEASDPVPDAAISATEVQQEPLGRLQRPGTGFDNLDQLIEQLEGARIEPHPNMDAVPPPDLENEDLDDMVSETLARIYAAQKQYAEAASVYERLAEQQPERAEEFSTKASELRSRVRKESGA